MTQSPLTEGEECAALYAAHAQHAKSNTAALSQGLRLNAGGT